MGTAACIVRAMPPNVNKLRVMGFLGKNQPYILIIININKALIAPVLLPYFCLAIYASLNPAIKGDIINMMLNPKITKFAYTQITADANPMDVPIITAAIPHLLSMI